MHKMRETTHYYLRSVGWFDFVKRKSNRNYIGIIIIHYWWRRFVFRSPRESHAPCTVGDANARGHNTLGLINKLYICRISTSTLWSLACLPVTRSLFYRPNRRYSALTYALIGSWMHFIYIRYFFGTEKKNKIDSPGRDRRPSWCMAGLFFDSALKTFNDFNSSAAGAIRIKSKLKSPSR